METTHMEASPDPWISALRHSHNRLRASVEPLGPDQLAQRSYPSEWTIAQVLSHLGSQAEIFGLILEAGLAGQEPPAREEFPPVWDKWNAKDPQAQATDALRADQATLERLESMDADERARLHLNLFGMDIDTTGFARLRLSDHAVHTWDVLVALDPAATLAPDAVDLLIDIVDQVAGRTASSGRSACPPPTRSGSSSWKRARRSRSHPRTETARPNWGCPSCGCPPR